VDLCYIDESGTPELPGTTSHYVLAGLAIPIWHWKDCEREINAIKRNHGLDDKELHTAWILRRYLEQSKIADFESLTFFQRRQASEQFRRGELLRLQKSPLRSAYKQTKKAFAHTDAYVHLTHSERQIFIREIATCIAGWGFARLFGECIDKLNFAPADPQMTVDEQALEQVVSRFERYMRAIGNSFGRPQHALLIHDNNDTVARKHTALMKKFHREGTLWTDVKHIVETPLFVNSELTSMVQIADLCGYALRRYFENQENELFDLIFQRADKRDNRIVGVRHFTAPGCQCKICLSRVRVGLTDAQIPPTN